ncbi:MAG: radical SAM protein [bacterium]|jgi:DNA repair photolyase
MNVIEVARVKVIEPCGLDLFDFQIDPYSGCAHQCAYCYTQNDAPLDWENEVGVVPGLEEKLRAELGSIAPGTIYMGMNTDPYQPAEKDFRQTRLVLEVLEEAGFSVCVLTKSDLVERDADVIKRMQGSSVGFSVAFTDEDARRAFEKNTISLEARLAALEKLYEMGIETYGLIDPVIPGLTDVDALLDLLAPCVDTVWVYALHMASREDPNWRATWDVLMRRFPEAFDAVERAALDKNDDYWAGLRESLLDRAESLPAKLEIHV